MKALLRELFPEILPSMVKKGDYVIVKVGVLYRHTKIVLTGDKNRISPHKTRPLIILDHKDETVQFIASTTDLFHRTSRPKIDLTQCNIVKSKDECFGLEKRKNAWIFAKKIKGKKLRFIYDIDVYTLKQLLNENAMKICGSCKQDIIEAILQTIKNFGDTYES